MDHWTESIRKILDGAPGGALSFCRLLEQLRLGGLGVEGRERWILQMLSEKEDQFKLIPDRRRLQSVQPPRRHPALPGSPRLPTLRGPDPWILPLGPAPPSGKREGTLDRLREGLRAWGRAVDEGSRISIARWIRANEEAERIIHGSAAPSRDQPA